MSDDLYMVMGVNSDGSYDLLRQGPGELHRLTRIPCSDRHYFKPGETVVVRIMGNNPQLPHIHCEQPTLRDLMRKARHGDDDATPLH